MKINIFQTKGKASKQRKSEKRSAKKEKFSAAERAAYNAGKGYAAAKAGGRVELRTEKEKESFRNGMASAKGEKKSK